MLLLQDYCGDTKLHREPQCSTHPYFDGTILIFKGIEKAKFVEYWQYATEEFAQCPSNRRDESSQGISVTNLKKKTKFI